MNKKIISGIGVFLFCFFAMPFTKVQAEETVYTISVEGLYRSPLDGKIEDSGGESQYALGQSMVDGVVDTTGILQVNEDGSYGLQVRFHLMDNISEVSFWTAEEGEDTWSSVSYASTGTTEETEDFYIPLPAETAYVRAQCYVDAMGRSVIFYLSYSDLTEGNTTDFSVYDASALSESGNGDVSASTDSSSSTVEATGEGLTIGYSSTQTEETTTAEENANGNLLDDNVWMLLFGVVFLGTLSAGLVLLLLVVLVYKIKANREELRALHVKKLDRYRHSEMEEDLFEI